MSTNIDLKNNVIFEKSIIISQKETIQDQNLDINGKIGQLRFNKDTYKFEGYHYDDIKNEGSVDVNGNKWRTLTQDIASTTNIGVIRIGANLKINSSTGVLTSIATGSGRLEQHIITVSPIEGAGEYTTISEAIEVTLGTSIKNYNDGALITDSAPTQQNQVLIVLAPGEYREQNIVLPDYVSIQGDITNTTTIIQTSGNDTITNGSLLVIGEYSEVKNIIFKLEDVSSSDVSNCIYSLNKNNIIIDNCIIMCNDIMNTKQNTYGIYIKNGSNNNISNTKININSTMLEGTVNAIYLNNTQTKIVNNSINILTPNSIINNGIYITNCISTNSIEDKIYIDNLLLSNNYNNTINNSSINTGIFINNSHLTIKNSEIEIFNLIDLSTNYGISLNSTGNFSPYLFKTTNNIISFVNTSTGINTIESSDINQINFLTENYDRGHYISVSGSQNNDGVYKISNSITSSKITLESGFNLNNESSSIRDITLKALYDINIYNSTIKATSNTIKNNDTNSNYICNLYNVINEGGVNNIEPSHTFYNDYKTITVGKVNCNFNSLYGAINSITDNNINNRYIIKVQSGIYHETNVITCKEYVNIEGIDSDNTILLFNRFSDTSGILNNDTSCILLSSHISIKNIKIQNTNTELLDTDNKITTSIINNITNPINNIVIENVKINGISYSSYIYGINLNNISNIILKNIEIIAKSNTTDSVKTIAIQLINTKDCIVNDVHTIINTVSTENNDNISLLLKDSECTIYNINLNTYSGHTNYGVKTENTEVIQKLIQLFNGQIRSYNNNDYSIICDDYYNIICNNIQLLGDTLESGTNSSINCTNCYTFTDENEKYNMYKLNSRGQNDEINETLTMDKTSGKKNALGKLNTFYGVNTGSSVTYSSYNTLIGSNTGKIMTTGNNNTLIGSLVGKKLLTSNNNTIIGSNAAVNITIGNDNVISGCKAGESIITANNNIIMGTNAASTLITGNLNVFIGDKSALNTTNSNKNTFIGNLSGISNETGNKNTYIGYNTGNSCIIGEHNVLVGNEAGVNNLSSNIVAIGNTSGYNNTSGIKNTYIGHNSGYNNTTGDCNTYIGHNAGYSKVLSTGAFNIAIGNESGYSITSGKRNILIGSTTDNNTNDAAGWGITTGEDNINIGTNSGSQATTANNNLLIGTHIGSNITVSSNNIILGKDTGNSLDTDGYSIIIGSGSGNQNTNGHNLIIGNNAGKGYTGKDSFTIGNNSGTNVEGEFNMFIGKQSGGSITKKSGSYNLAIGPYTGHFLTSGTRNTIIGSGNSEQSAGKQISIGSDNTFIGYRAGSRITEANRNTLIGSNAGVNLSSGSNNLILGYSAGFDLNTGQENICLGNKSGNSLTEGNQNILVGHKAGYKIQTSNKNINIGSESGYECVSGHDNINIGYKAGYENTSNDNIFIGLESGKNNTTGTNNIFLGKNAGKSNEDINSKQTGNDNIFIGTESGLTNTSGKSNIFVGKNTGRSNTTGTKNIYIGDNIGLNIQDISHNIFIGSSSSTDKGIGSNCIVSGSDIGEKNIFIGHDVGMENTIGDGNIFLGDSAGKNNKQGKQNIYIGKSAGENSKGDESHNNIALGFETGKKNEIGKENIFIGKNVANNSSDDVNNNIIIGTNAGLNIKKDNEIYIGTKAGEKNTDGNNNIFIGNLTGQNNIISSDNVLIGDNTGKLMTGTNTVGSNTLIGSNCGSSLTTGINNVVIGSQSMNNGNADDVIIIGANAGKENTADGNIFIGSQAGEKNTSGIGNIYIGKKSGLLNETSNGNIIFGDNTVINGKISDNNIIIGNETSKNVNNKILFKNNIVIGSEAGKDSNLSKNSIIVGTNAIKNGSGGEVNIIMGNQCGINLGNPKHYNAITLTTITTLINYVYIDITFGTGGYYFNVNDFIIIESSNSDYKLNTQIIGLFIGIGEFINKTQVFFKNTATEEIPVNSTLYLQTIKSDIIGLGDYGKSSSNMCIGDNSGYYLTTGSKNTSIGDKAMYNNISGKYNISLGTESGFNLQTNNNLCLGIQSGFSLDKYKLETIYNDFVFNSNTNIIETKTSLFTNLFSGTIFKIDNSSYNDNKYVLDYINDEKKLLKIIGYPNIKEDKIITHKSAFFTIANSEFKYVNTSYPNSKYPFEKITIVTGFNKVTSARNDNAFTNEIFIPYYGMDNYPLATNFVNEISNSTYVTIKNSKFNDGVKLIMMDGNLGQGDGTPPSGIVNNIYSGVIQIYCSTLLYSEGPDRGSDNITIEFNNIVNTTATIVEKSFYNIFKNNKIFFSYGKNKNIYNVDNVSNFYEVENINNYNRDPIKPFINGIIVKEPIKHENDLLNLVYTKGSIDNGIIQNNNIFYATSGIASSLNITFDEQNNKIINVILKNDTNYKNNFNIPDSGLLLISGTIKNNGYYFYKSYIKSGSIDFIIDKNFPLKEERIFHKGITPGYSGDDLSIPLGDLLPVVKFEVVELINLYNNLYNDTSSFNGSLININYKSDNDNNYLSGNYIINRYYNGCYALNDNLLSLNVNTNTNTNTDINIAFNDLNIKIKNEQNTYISSSDLIFQKNKIQCDDVEFNNSQKIITTDIKYGFIDIIAPVWIKISDTSNNNDKFLLVEKNLRPFDRLEISNNSNFTDETCSTCNISMNCVSSYTNLVDLSILIKNKNYLVYGNNNNNTIIKYDLDNCIDKSSVYLSEDTIIENDTFNDVHNIIMYINNIYKNDVDNNVLRWENKFVNKKYDEISIEFISPNKIKLLKAKFDLDIYNELFNHSLKNYIKIEAIDSIHSLNYDGLYYIDTVIENTADLTYTLNDKYIRSDVTNTNLNFTTNTINCNLKVNEFRLDEGSLNNDLPYDFIELINMFGENSKFLTFTNHDMLGTISKDNSLTFEIESHSLNLSSKSVFIKEDVPMLFSNIQDLDSNYQLKQYYLLISIGSPNPSNKISNIKRTNKRPIIYSKNNILLDTQSYNHDIDNLYSPITISVDETNIYTILQNTRSAVLDSGTTFTYKKFGKKYTNDYTVFKKNDILEMRIDGSDMGFAIDSTFIYAINTVYFIKILTVSKTEMTYTLLHQISINTNPPHNIGELPQESYRLISLSAYKTIKDENMDFTEFDFTTLSNNNFFNLYYYKYPCSYSKDFLNNYVLKINFENISNLNNVNIDKEMITSNSVIDLTKNLDEIILYNTLIIDSDNIDFNYTNISFHNLEKSGNDFQFYNSNNTITTTQEDFSNFIKSEYILISNTTYNNGLYRINDNVSPTTNSIIISDEYNLMDDSGDNITIKANNINTSDNQITDLSIFYSKQKIIITNTILNNKNYTIHINSNSKNSIFIDSENVTTEYPNYCNIETSNLIDETSKIYSDDFSFDSQNKTINTSNTEVNLSLLRVNQSLQIENNSTISNITISNTSIPSNTSIKVNEDITIIPNISTILSKNIKFNIIGEPIISTSEQNNINFYNGEDSEGNNSMIGSFAGKFTGSLNNTIYNISLGSKCAQINHGSGNIFIGNETKLAKSALDEGHTFYNNKFAIYKTNSLGIPGDPLIGGDFTSNRVGINTLFPENFLGNNVISNTNTKLIVNGGVIANGYAPFTGCHKIQFINSNIILNIKPGMIISTTGKINKTSIMNTICNVDISKVNNDKTIFGIYAYKENIKENETQNQKYNNENLSFDNNFKTIYYSASLGEGCILVCNYSGEIQNGDYITTCVVAGYGCLQSDDFLHSYTVAKCTETIDWNIIKETVLYNGIEYKVYLAGCTYHCG